MAFFFFEGDTKLNDRREVIITLRMFVEVTYVQMDLVTRGSDYAGEMRRRKNASQAKGKKEKETTHQIPFEVV